MAPELLFIIVLVLLLVYWARRRRQPNKHAVSLQPFRDDHRRVLLEQVAFYRALNDDERTRFENEMQYFLATTKITGIDTEVTQQDRALIGASAIIPVFGFHDWEYHMLDEVLLYPGAFNQQFETHADAEGRSIIGMVGSGVMQGKMILSQPALRHGFDVAGDKQNVGIHEFVHLVDKADGNIDGLPHTLEDKHAVLPWLDLMHKKIQAITGGDSDIRDYGATNKQEFLAVASEYFFEQPKLLKQKHPLLYKQLSKVFQQDLETRLLKPLSKRKPGRNDPCWCGSGEKYKHCCLN